MKIIKKIKDLIADIRYIRKNLEKISNRISELERMINYFDGSLSDTGKHFDGRLSDIIKYFDGRINQIINENNLNTQIILNLTAVNIKDISPAIEGSELRNVQLNCIKIFKEFDIICRRNNIPYWINNGTAIGALRHGGFIPWDDDIDIGMLRQDYNRFKEIIREEEKGSCFYSLYLEDIVKYPHCYPVSKNTFIIYFGKLIFRKNKHLLPENKYLFHENKYSCIDIFPFDYIPDEITDLEGHKKFRLSFFSDKLINYIDTTNINQNTVDKCIEIYKDILSKTTTNIKSKYIDYGIEFGFGSSKNFSVLEIDDFFPLREIEFEGIKTFIPKNIEKILTKEYGNFMSYPKQFNNHANLPYIRSN